MTLINPRNTIRTIYLRRETQTYRHKERGEGQETNRGSPLCTFRFPIIKIEKYLYNWLVLANDLDTAPSVFSDGGESGMLRRRSDDNDLYLQLKSWY